MIPVSSRPATVSQGNPSGRAASSPHQCRRNTVTAVLIRASCRWPTSARARHTVGVDGIGPITGARCRRPWKSLMASPPSSWVTARSTSSWPRSYSGVNPRRVIAVDSPARSPVRSASSRSGSAPADPTRRSSSPTSSSRSAHELCCTEEVHLPGQLTIFDKSHSAWSGAPRHVYPKITPGVSSTPVKDGGQRRGQRKPRGDFGIRSIRASGRATAPTRLRCFGLAWIFHRGGRCGPELQPCDFDHGLSVRG